jgi:hypothetical protein
MNESVHEPLFLTTARFNLGRIVITQSALEIVPHPEVMEAIARHASGDWGELDDHDLTVNESAVAHGSRTLSSYKTAFGETFWVITEEDPSRTTILLPEDY